MRGELSDCEKCFYNTLCCPCLFIVNIVFTACVICKCTKDEWELITIKYYRRRILPRDQNAQK